MTKQFTLLLFTLFVFANAAFTQDLVFTQDGKELQEGSTVYYSERNILGSIHAHVLIKNKGEKGSASLTVTVLEESIGGNIGFCGWGIETCTPIPYGSSHTRTTSIEANEELDPAIEAMNTDPSNTLIKVQYKLAYADTEKILNVVFTTNETSISIPSDKMDIILYHKDGSVFVDYNFPTAQTRELVLYNIVGAKVAQYTLADNANTLAFPNLPKGIYMYSIVENGQSVKCGKYIF